MPHVRLLSTWKGNRAGWTGLQRTVHVKGSKPQPAAASRQLRDTALNAGLRACRAVRDRGIRAPLLFLQSAGQFNPDPRQLASIVATAAEKAAAHPPVVNSGAGGADAAAEAFARLVDSGIAVPSPPLLAAVAREAARDPVAERRGARVLSVIARLRTFRVAPTPELIYACFSTAVAAVDLQLVAALHNFALANELCTMQTPASKEHLAALRRSALPGDSVAFCAFEHDEVRAQGKRAGRGIPSALMFYNGVLRTALFTSHDQVAAVALRELHARGVGVDATTLALLAALHANSDDASGARDILSGLIETGDKVPSVAFAALVRYFGRRGDFAAARAVFDEWEDGNSRMFWQALSSPCRATIFQDGRVSAKTIAGAGDCVVFSLFQAARAAGDGQGVVQFVEHLKERYGYGCSRFVERIVMETCWRAGRQDLAREVHAMRQGLQADQFGNAVKGS